MLWRNLVSFNRYNIRALNNCIGPKVIITSTRYLHAQSTITINKDKQSANKLLKDKRLKPNNKKKGKKFTQYIKMSVPLLNNTNDNLPNTINHLHPKLSSEIQLNEKESKLCILIKNYIDSYNNVSNTQPLVARISGGWVRDKILGKQSHDLDIAINLMSGEEFVHNMLIFYSKNPLPECFLNYEKDCNNKKNNGKSKNSPFFHNVNTIKKNPEKSKHLETATTKILGMDIDFVNLRNETYTENSRIPIISHGTPQEDAIRRDATLNALFYNISTNQVEDFTQCGLQDLHDGILRTPLDPLQTFMDDPLRILRLIRFSAVYNFKLHESIEQCFVQHHKDLMNALQKKISKERIGVELMKMLDHDLECCKRGLKICCDFNFLTSIFHHCFNENIMEINKDNENEDLIKIEKIYQYENNMESNGPTKNTLNHVCYTKIINNTEFPWVKDNFSSSSPQQSLKSETDTNQSNKILVFSCLLSVFEKIHIYTTIKNKNVKNLKNSMAEWILRDTLRFGKQYYQPVAMIVENISSLHNFIVENLSQPQQKENFKRSDICEKIILYEEYLPIALEVEKILFGNETYQLIQQQVDSLKLEQVYQVKPLINGKELVSILNKKPGVWMSAFNKQILHWQYDHPTATREDLIQNLGSFTLE